ncbi:MAG: archease [Deltaproteobacteria bacterium]|nr:archease [Deltaproteobacteria bacterium]
MINQDAHDYLLLDHTADMGLEIRGSGPADLFEKAGRALINIMLGDIHPQGSDNIRVSLTGDDLSDLMVRWLTEILYILEGEHLITTDIIVNSLSTTAIDATLTVTPFDPLRHEIMREIKAVTYHQIEVTHKEGVWKARVIFDL